MVQFTRTEIPPYSGSRPFLIKKEKRVLPPAIRLSAELHSANGWCTGLRRAGTPRLRISPPDGRRLLPDVRAAGLCFVSKTNTQMSSGNNQDSTIRLSRKQRSPARRASGRERRTFYARENVVRSAGFGGFGGMGLGHGQTCPHAEGFR